MGTLCLGFGQEHTLTPAHLDIAREVANSVAIALQQAHLNEQISNGRERLRSLTRRLVETHVAYTDSAVGRALLADWPAAVRRVSAIVPRDFRRVLEATRRATAAGEDVDAAIMAAARP